MTKLFFNVVPFLATVLLFLLKVVGGMSISWLVVTSPIWVVGVATGVVLTFLFLILGAISVLEESW